MGPTSETEARDGSMVAGGLGAASFAGAAGVGADSVDELPQPATPSARAMIRCRTRGEVFGIAMAEA
jgi:hypothetical protein